MDFGPYRSSRYSTVPVSALPCPIAPARLTRHSTSAGFHMVSAVHRPPAPAPPRRQTPRGPVERSGRRRRPENVERICDGHILSNLVHLWKPQCCNGLRTALQHVSYAYRQSRFIHLSVPSGAVTHFTYVLRNRHWPQAQAHHRTRRGSSDVTALYCLPAGILNGHGATEMATRVAGKPITSQRIASRSYLCPEHTLSACASSLTPPCLAAGTGERPRSAARTSSRPRELA